MTLIPGHRLGPHEIVAAIGAGGMGEVFRARDTKLNRDVAIKVLPAAFADDPERLARFNREAQTLASLNHPNIAAIYGIEEIASSPSSDGLLAMTGGDDLRGVRSGVSASRALVMELVEGEDLSTQMARGPIPITEALPIARQIAEALEAAHEQGIVHRDLKPANIKVRADGTVKVLDFGLAKAMDPAGGASSNPNVSHSPTLTHQGTSAGMIIGTAAYMSPEQAKGKPVDKRADIWSFGVVLYEMLTGTRLFRGEDASDTLAAVLTKEPAWTTLPPEAPEAVRRLLRRCLEKDRRKRLADSSDARLDIEEALNPRAAEANSVADAGPAAPVMWIAATGVLALALIALTAVHLREPPASAMPRFEFTLTPAGRPFSGVASASGTPLISPDGKWVLIGTELRRLDASGSQTIEGRGLGSRSFWSPDSRWVAMFSGIRNLVKVRIPDGTSETIAPLPGPSRGGAWAESGALLVTSYSSDDQATLRVWLPGDTEFKPVDIPGLQAHESIYLPEFLDGGPDVLFLMRERASGEGKVYLATLQGRTLINPVQLMANTTVAHYTIAAGGRLLFVRGDNLYAQRLDLRSRRLDGDPELVRKGVATSPVFGMAAFSVSRDGVLVWRSGGEAGAFVTTFDREGRVLGTSGPQANSSWIRLAPDQKHAATYGEDRGSQFLEIGQNGSLGLTGRIRNPVWMPGGTRLLYVDDTLKRWFEGPAGRSGDVRERSHPDNARSLADVSPDGLTALYTTEAGAVFAARLDGPQAQPAAVADTGTPIYCPRFSPDGRFVVYTESAGTPNVFVQPFQGDGARRQIASNAQHVVWRGDGKEILFTSPFEGQTWVTSVQVSGSGGDLRFGEPRRLFAVRPGPGLVIGATPLAVSADGSRIFYPQAVESPEESKVIQVSTAWMLKANPGVDR